MKINKQTNTNTGDVYNIEQINAVTNNNGVNISYHLQEESIIPKQRIEGYKQEASLILFIEAGAFLLDLFEIIPSLNWPWWVWGFIALASMFYLTLKYEDAYGISDPENIQISEEGVLLIPNDKGLSKTTCTAPCMYPNCQGKIVPIELPSDYDGPYKIMGKCSTANLQHGYVIDDNLQAYPHDIHTYFKSEL